MLYFVNAFNANKFASMAPIFGRYVLYCMRPKALSSNDLVIYFLWSCNMFEIGKILMALESTFMQIRTSDDFSDLSIYILHDDCTFRQGQKPVGEGYHIILIVSRSHSREHKTWSPDLVVIEGDSRSRCCGVRMLWVPDVKWNDSVHINLLPKMACSWKDRKRTKRGRSWLVFRNDLRTDMKIHHETTKHVCRR